MCPRCLKVCVCPLPEIYCCGLLSTRKSDCTGLPQSMLVNPESPQQRGQSRSMMRGNTSLISWYNKGHFRFLTNAYSPTKKGKETCFGTDVILPMFSFSYIFIQNMHSGGCLNSIQSWA